VLMKDNSPSLMNLGSGMVEFSELDKFLTSFFPLKLERMLGSSIDNTAIARTPKTTNCLQFLFGVFLRLAGVVAVVLFNDVLAIKGNFKIANRMTAKVR
jgi:hypothetical protein